MVMVEGVSETGSVNYKDSGGVLRTGSIAASESLVLGVGRKIGC